MTMEVRSSATDLEPKCVAIGCAFSIVTLNTLLLGLIAWSFSHGPYSSHGQEVFYRYYSIGLFLAGAIAPAIILLLGAKRSLIATVALIAWMLFVLVNAIMYAVGSGGGV
jgi:hypothetical protein